MSNKIFLLVAIFFFIVALYGQSYENQAYIISSGGGLVNGAEYENFIIIGEPIINSEISGGTYSGAIGFLPIAVGGVNIEEEKIQSVMTNVSQNYPNPFNPETTINYSIKKDLNVLIEIYNIKGQKVKTLVDEFRKAGYHSVIWNGKDSGGKPVSSGLYFYRMKTDKYQKIRKMLLLK